MTKDKNKHYILNSFKKDIYVYYVINKGAYHVYAKKENEIKEYLSFTNECAAKEACYWISGYLIMHQKFLSDDDFLNMTFSTGTFKWVS